MAENKKTYHYDLRGRNGQMYLVLDKYLGLLIRSDKYRNIAQSSAIAGFCIFLTAILFRDRGNSGRLPPIETAMLLFLSPVLIVICIKQLIYVIVALDMPDYDGKTQKAQRADSIISQDGLEAVYDDFMEAEPVADTELMAGRRYIFVKDIGMARKDDIEDCIMQENESESLVVLTVRDENGDGSFRIKEIQKGLSYEERRAEFGRAREEIFRGLGKK